MNGPWRLAYNTRSVVTTVVLAVMHNKLLRTDDYKRNGRFAYNQSSVAFTLLTFAYLVAEAWESKGDRFPVSYFYNEDDWYFFWKMLGSSLGLGVDFMPDNHSEAKELWDLFLSSDECYNQWNLVDNGLLAAFGKAKVDPKLLASWLPAYFWTQLKHISSWTLEPALDRLILADLIEAIAAGEVSW